MQVWKFSWRKPSPTQCLNQLYFPTLSTTRRVRGLRLDLEMNKVGPQLRVGNATVWTVVPFPGGRRIECSKMHNLRRSQRCGATGLDHRRRAASARFRLRVSAGSQGGPEHRAVSRRTSRKFHQEGEAMKGPRPATATSDKEVLHRFGYAQQLLRDMGGFSNFAISFRLFRS